MSTGARTHNPTPKRSAKVAPNQSLNHLLNFTLPPRQSHQFSSVPTRRRKAGTQQGVWNKERFVNAQYRFIMNPAGDYTVHFADPDIFFQWHDILQVIVPRSSVVASAVGSSVEGITTCPICLSSPAAPRMTKCGHVFCFPCILHYLNTSDNLKWARCPICFDSIHEKQLKSVKWFEGISDHDIEASSSGVAGVPFGETPTPGSTLHMRLIQRPAITTLALPRSQTWPSDILPPLQTPFHFLPDVYPFAKFMLATPATLVSDLTKELDDLAVERRVLASMHDHLGVSFVDAADAKVRHQIEKAAALETLQLKDAIEGASLLQRQLTQARHAPLPATPLPDTPESFVATVCPSRPGNAPQTLSTSEHSQRVLTPTRGLKQRRNLNPPPPSTSTYYYYQAASGMPIYLHPLDIKILLTHFNSYASFPDEISVRVESYAESTVNEELRKRWKYLAHLPEGADVVFVETDLEDVVGQDSLKSFERPLSMRRARRDQKSRKEDKAKVRAEERDKEKLISSWNYTTRMHVNAQVDSLATSQTVASVEVDVDEFTERTEGQATPQGVWGDRSFASAAQSPAPAQRPVSQNPEREAEDEWDLDAAFHELESRSAKGGRRRNARLVVLGGGGASGRRR